MIAAAVIYFYDFLLTFLSEIKYCGRKGLFTYIFASVRTTSGAYQMIVVVKISLDSWTSKNCAEWSSIAQAFDAIFQFLCVVGISLRTYAVYNRNRIVIGLLLPVGLLGPLLNVAVPNPSVFPRCRAFDSTPSSEYVPPKLVPCIRTIFDMVAAILILARLRPSFWGWSLARKFGVEGGMDLSLLLCGILTIEAICVQVSTNARNFIGPFLDS
ncbi:hypothetical protein GGX14DRAFT_483747 [Mycena pura]|uniref:Uncharacterized protein n=1 Tax=Mycena pura TaxID=153505 RepID=A0AAD6ULI1_9AGAR|nr:hypothetical protein GGX14DRAFT_483747 [Mycena pura]